jgi:hypothetical protein
LCHVEDIEIIPFSIRIDARQQRRAVINSHLIRYEPARLMVHRRRAALFVFELSPKDAQSEFVSETRRF